MIKPDLLYSAEHEWIRLNDQIGVVGITDYAQTQLGDVVFVELPQVGTVLNAGAAFGVVESVKSVSDLYAPVSGRVSNVNDKLIAKPELLNEQPYDEGWIIEIELTDPTEADNLLSADEYKAQIGE